MLSTIFASENGLAARLIDALGTRARYKRFLRDDQDAVFTIRCVEETLEQTEGATKTPGKKSWNSTVMSNGLRRLESRAVYLVPSVDVPEEPRVGLDRLEIDAREFRLERVEPIRANDRVVAYRFFCERV